VTLLDRAAPGAGNRASRAATDPTNVDPQPDSQPPTPQPEGFGSTVPLSRCRIAEGPSGILVWSLAIQAAGPVHADPMSVIEIDDPSSFSLLGFFLGELIYDCDDPPVLLHGIRTPSFYSFCFPRDKQ
jgi:hypothetical protein